MAIFPKSSQKYLVSPELLKERMLHSVNHQEDQIVHYQYTKIWDSHGHNEKDLSV